MPLIKPTFQMALEGSLKSAFEELFLAPFDGLDLGDATSETEGKAKSDAADWAKSISKVLSDEIDSYIKTALVQTDVMPGISLMAGIYPGSTIAPGKGIGSLT